MGLHEYVLSGSNKEHISYDQPKGGWLWPLMRGEKILKLKTTYLIILWPFDDANDFSWDAAKASHMVFLRHMEQCKVANYSQVEKIDMILRANAQRHI